MTQASVARLSFALPHRAYMTFLPTIASTTRASYRHRRRKAVLGQVLARGLRRGSLASRSALPMSSVSQLGRVLEEVDVDGFSTTTFVVDPADNGATAKISIRATVRLGNYATTAAIR